MIFSEVCPNGVVLDANFIVSLIQVDPIVRRFARYLAGARVSTVILGETFYILKKNTITVTEPQVEKALSGLGVLVEPVSIEVPRKFNFLKSIDSLRIAEQRKQGLSGRDVKSLSLGDLVCLGYASEVGLPVLTNEMHWFTLGKHGLTTTLLNYRDPQITF